MSNPFRPVLESLAKQRGVQASLIVSESDGLIVDASLRFGQDGDRVAALAASLFRKAQVEDRRVVRLVLAELVAPLLAVVGDEQPVARPGARLGDVAFFQLDAERGRICAVGGRSDLVLMVVAEPNANVGLIRVELLKALDMLA